jgi:hypothetical protein
LETATAASATKTAYLVSAASPEHLGGILALLGSETGSGRSEDADSLFEAVRGMLADGTSTLSIGAPTLQNAQAAC